MAFFWSLHFQIILRSVQWRALLQPLLTAAALVPCDLILSASSLASAGRGVFAGRFFRAEEVIEVVPTLLIPHEVVVECQLKNYVFGTNDPNYDMILYGSGSLYNYHESLNSISHYWTEPDEDVKDPATEIKFALPYSNYTKNLQ